MRLISAASNWNVNAIGAFLLYIHHQLLLVVPLEVAVTNHPYSPETSPTHLVSVVGCEHESESDIGIIENAEMYNILMTTGSNRNSNHRRPHGMASSGCICLHSIQIHTIDCDKIKFPNIFQFQVCRCVITYFRTFHLEKNAPCHSQFHRSPNDTVIRRGEEGRAEKSKAKGTKGRIMCI